MAYIIVDPHYKISETDISATTGAVTSTAQIDVSGLAIGTIVLAAHYVESTSTWKLLIASPQ